MNLKGDLVEKRGCCSVEWKIKDFFSTSPGVNGFWSSPSFHISDASWCLQVYPNGQTCHKSVGWISIYLKKKESETEIHEVCYTIGVKASDDTEIKSWNYTNCFKKSDSSYGWPKFCERKELHEKSTLHPDDTVTFFCQARVIGEEIGVDAESQTDNKGCSRLNRDLKELFLSEEGADVTIKVKDRELRAHSLILSARSSVFAPMFRHVTKEKNTGVVEIPEFEPDAFKEFLIFLYSGRTENLSSDNDIDLYSAADKYDIGELKTICSEFMKENITVDSFCEVLSLAIRYSDKDLLNFLTDYFIKNVKKITVIPKWISVVKEFPIESNELVIKLAHNFLPD